MAVLNLDLSQSNFQETPEALLPGWYPAVMIESDVVATAAKTGFRLACVYQVIDGPGKGRKILAGYNVDNPNPEAVRISMEELKTLSACMGHFAPLTDSAELHNRPLQLRLAKQKDSDFNEVKGYKTIDGKDAKDAAQGPAIGHQPIPTQGFAAPAPQPPYAVPAATQYPVDPSGQWMLVNGQYVPNTQVAAPPPPPPPPAPAPVAAWAPPAPPAAPQAAAPAYAPPAAAGAPPAPPAWAPATAGPVAPSWTPQR